MSQPYAYEILNELRELPMRFKDFSSVCRVEKTRSKRLKELISIGLIVLTTSTRFGERPTIVYGITRTGKKILRILDQIE